MTNLAWIRTQRMLKRRAGQSYDREAEKMPMLLYTAINIRPRRPTQSSQQPLDDWVYPTLAYQNFVLPSFLPSSPPEENIFWYRAQCVKKQSRDYIRHALLSGRTLRSYEERCQRAIRFATEDDSAEPSLRNVAWPVNRAPPAPSIPARLVQGPSSAAITEELASSRQGPSPLLPKAPSIALMGLTLTGDLDRIYKHSKHYGEVIVESLRGSARQAPGGILIAGRTLNGRMTFSLLVDRSSFEEGVLRTFWDCCGRCVGEYMVGVGEMELAESKL